MAAKTKLFKLVATWLAEVRRESDPAATLAQYGGVAPVALTFDDVREAAVDAAMGRQGYDVLGAYVPVDNLVYVNAISGLDANPGTQALPVQTIERAMELLARGWTRWGVMFLSADTYVMPSQFFAAAANNTLFAGSSGAFPLQVIGTYVDSGEGTLTAANPIVAGSLTTPAAFTVTATGGTSGAWVANQWRGYLMRKTSAGATGAQFLVSSNTANVVSGTMAAAPVVAGDTFVLERPGTVLTVASFSAVAYGADIVLRGCEIRGVGGLTIFGQVGIMGGWVTNGGAGSMTLSVARAGALTTGISALIAPNKTNAADPTQVYAARDDVGVFFSGTGGTGSVTFSQGCSSGLRRCVFRDARVTAATNGLFSTVGSFHFGASAIRATHARLALSSVILDAVTPDTSSGAAVSAEYGADVQLATSSVANTPATTAPGDAVAVRNGSSAEIQSCIGTGNAGVGVRCGKQSRVAVVLPGTSVTVTGAGGDCVVGANAVAPWTGGGSIAAGAAANTTDLAAAIPQICSVSAP